jgi:YHS domain-containing protein
LVLNVLGLAIFAALFYLTARRGATDPVCGMKVDRARALRAEHAGRTYFFCSEDCRSALLADPGGYTQNEHAPAEAHAAGHAH